MAWGLLRLLRQEKWGLKSRGRCCLFSLYFGMFLKSGWPWTSRVWEGYEDNFDRTVGPGVIVLLYSVMFAVLLYL